MEKEENQNSTSVNQNQDKINETGENLNTEDNKECQEEVVEQ